MPDNEIIKALEETLQLMCCEGDLQKASIISNTLDLINRQKAEIERFQKAWEMFSYLNEAVHYVEIGGKVETVEFVSAEAKQKAINKKLDLLCNARKAKSEAQKELAERLKTRHHIFKTADNICIKCIPLDYIDSTLAEMESERK